MASQVAPGYNPEVSLLQGGTAPIVPVQGGGGMEAGASLPSNYNPDTSLLNTGSTVPIVPIRGGGKEVQEGGDASTYEAYSLEIYKPPLDPAFKKPVIRSIDNRQKTRKDYIDWVRTAQGYVTSYANAPEKNITRYQPSYEFCRMTLKFNTFKHIKRHVVFLDSPSPKIFLVHDIKGDIGVFLQTLKQLTDSDKPKALPLDTYIVFTGLLFTPLGKEVPQTDAQIFDIFLQWKLLNKYNIFMIVEHSEGFRRAACAIEKNLAAGTTSISDSTKLAAYYEPDILVFLKQRIVFKNGPLPVMKVGADPKQDIKVSTILQRYSDTYKDIFIKPSEGLDYSVDDLPSHSDGTSVPNKYFFIELNPEGTKSMTFPAESDIRCPEGQTCSGFEKGYKLTSLKDEQKLPSPGLYLLEVNNDGKPFFKTAASAAPSIPKAAAKPEVKKPTEVVEEKKDEEEDEVVVVIPEGAFQPSPNAIKAVERTIDLNAMKFNIRYAVIGGIKDDWKKLQFIQGEADFLNALQLTPKLLSQTFGEESWPDQLAGFLEKIVMSNCFQDTTLLTNRECGNAQHFIKQVYLRLFSNTLETMYDEYGVPKPDRFKEVLDQLRNLLRLIRDPKEAEVLVEFTGDWLDRFYLMDFDPSSKTFSAEAAVLPEKTKEALKALKFYRVQDTDLKALTQALTEKLPRKGLAGVLARLKGSPSPPKTPEEPKKPEVPKSSEKPKASEEPKKPEADKQVSFTQLSTIIPPVDLFQEPINVKADGLCFFRAVLKGLLPNPVADSATSYIPTKAETDIFIREIKTWLESKRNTVIVGGTPVEQHFNDMYGPPRGASAAAAEVPREKHPGKDGRLSEADLVGYIPIQGVGYKMTFQQYLDKLLDPDYDARPYADVEEAGIGAAAAALKGIAIVFYTKDPADPSKYTFGGPMYMADEASTIPLSKVVFLEHVGGNHFNLLKLKSTATWPDAPVTAGGGELEVLDLGVLIEARSQTRKRKERKTSTTQTRKLK